MQRCILTSIGIEADHFSYLRSAAARHGQGGSRKVLSFEEFVQLGETAQTVCQLEACFERAMADEGFENYIIGKMVDRRLVRSDWARFPDGHFETYLAEQWDTVDPILAYAATATRPFYWDDVASHRQLNQAQTALLEECRRVGVHSVLVAPFPNRSGGCDIVGVSRRYPEPVDRARLAVLQAMCAHTWYRQAELSGRDPEARQCDVSLTSRELEILKWVRDGKSNSEMSEIMSLSVKTIEYHVGNLLKKLGAPNRTTAVVIAVRQHLLTL